jgi:hypothetical protein
MARVRRAALNLRAREWIEVRSEQEILETLDEFGCCEQLPFMPEMLQYCGRRFQVVKRSDKTCDPAHTPWTIRRMEHSVHLEGVRCDGSGHGKCEAGCLIWWKEAWLKRVEGDLLVLNSPQTSFSKSASLGSFRTHNTVLAAAQTTNAEGETIYRCQATDVCKFTSYMSWWDPRQYVRDLRNGNLRSGLALDSISERSLELILGVLQSFRAFFISFFTERRTLNYPAVVGTKTETPIEKLDLQPGELVRVRSKEEIMATLDKHRRNRGLLFDGEMIRFCGNVYRVLRQVRRIVDERSGKMMHMKYPCVILEGVACQSDYHRLCPRAIYHYWRENWLMRLTDLPTRQGTKDASGGERVSDRSTTEKTLTSSESFRRSRAI